MALSDVERQRVAHSLLAEVAVSAGVSDRLRALAAAWCKEYRDMVIERRLFTEAKTPAPETKDGT